MKNVNYLPNVLSKMEAEEKGAFALVWVDEDRCNIAEGPNANIVIVSRKRELILPKLDRVLHGCTAKRLLMLGKKLVGKGILKSVESRDISAEEAKSSSEMIFVSSLIPIMPVVEWDGEAIGDGEKPFVYSFFGLSFSLIRFISILLSINFFF
ncbi:Branched-chain-amino-acid aminotransferase-like protein 3, chloroplastic [Apostasia shenzhenica]|uniref:Branched-chain-amino-acid aminotransferase-like protein 3, chloroplastic n=1 Tax=Apostasia shenzhenica TaxID=1088818 RepID=A0A2I0AUK7_9ASPA|nr:Branched-chain-amino-acid aminotransferase-like protein 3, chloroplastic [Apostasia shenzhenica]